VSGEWRRLRNEELCDVYCSPNIIRVSKSRRMRWAGHVALWGRGEAYTRFCWGNVRDKRLLGRPRRRWEDYIKGGRGGMDWIELAQDRDR